MTMRLSNLLIAVASISSAVGQVSAKGLRQGKIVHQDRREAQRTSFDFYVLSMSYQPEFCYMNRRGGFPGCENPLEFWRGGLTLHGMWPEDDDGSWPSTCTNEKFDPSTVYDLGEDRFNKLWPNVKSSSADSKSHDSFWEHEWTKHGTCTGMTQDEYFDTALKHFLPTPQIVRDNYGKSCSRDELLEAYRTDQSDMYGDVVLVCSGGKYLSEVRVCVAKSADGSGSDRIKCIPQVEEEDTCGSEIIIQKFYIDDDEMVQVAR